MSELLGGGGGVTLVVVTGVAAAEEVSGVAAVGVAGRSAGVVAAVMGALCWTAAMVLAVPVVSEKVAATPAGQRAGRI